MTAPAIAVLGTGRMGTAFARRLVETGHTVLVWNRTQAGTQSAVEAGATPVATLADAVARADTLVTSLTDAAALDAVYRGPDGLIAAGITGRLCIEMSTVLPTDQQALAQAATEAGADYVECPVGGTVGPALKGALLGLAGGEPSAFARAEPILRCLCKRVDQLGPVGTGSAMKLAVNLPLALYWHALGEARRLVSGFAVDGETFAGVLADSSAGPTVLRNRMAVVAATLDGEDQPGTFDIDGLTKDLALALEWAERTGTTLPLAERALTSYRAAADTGLGRCDGASLARFLAAGDDVR